MYVSLSCAVILCGQRSCDRPTPSKKSYRLSKKVEKAGGRTFQKDQRLLVTYSMCLCSSEYIGNKRYKLTVTSGMLVVISVGS